MTSSTTTAAAGADFTQLSTHATELAFELGVEIVGCARGFNAFNNGEIISDDCTAAEIERWLEGYGRAKVHESAHNVMRFTDVEFQRSMDHVLYRNWSMVADQNVAGAQHTQRGAGSVAAIDECFELLVARDMRVEVRSEDFHASPDQDADGAE